MSDIESNVFVQRIQINGIQTNLFLEALDPINYVNTFKISFDNRSDNEFRKRSLCNKNYKKNLMLASPRSIPDLNLPLKVYGVLDRSPNKKIEDFEHTSVLFFRVYPMYC